MRNCVQTRRYEKLKNLFVFQCKEHKTTFKQHLCLRSQTEHQVCYPNLAFHIKKNPDLKASLPVLSCSSLKHPDETGLSTFEIHLPTVIHGSYTTCVKDECCGFLFHLALCWQQICQRQLVCSKVLPSLQKINQEY